MFFLFDLGVVIGGILKVVVGGFVVGKINGVWEVEVGVKVCLKSIFFLVDGVWLRVGEVDLLGEEGGWLFRI